MIDKYQVAGEGLVQEYGVPEAEGAIIARIPESLTPR
jgi:hypothetical protein